MDSNELELAKVRDKFDKEFAKHDKQLNFRITLKQKLNIEEAASALDTRPSVLARRWMLEGAKAAGFDLDTLPI